MTSIFKSKRANRNGFYVTGNTFGNSENPCPVRAVTTVTLFYNSLRARERKYIEGRKKRKGDNSIKMSRKKLLRVLPSAAKRVFAKVCGHWIVLRKLLRVVTELVTTLPPLMKKESGRVTVANITFPLHGKNILRCEHMCDSIGTAHGPYPIATPILSTERAFVVISCFPTIMTLCPVGHRVE